MIKTIGKKSTEGIERIGEASGFGSRPTSEEAGCSDLEMHAGTCKGPGTHSCSACAHVY